MALPTPSANSTSVSQLSISLLGPFRVTRDGDPIIDFATDKARGLLAYLAVEADHPHRRDALAGLLWPDEPEARARQNLRQALSYLRQAIRDSDATVPYLLVSRRTIQFNRDSDHWLDVARFATLAEDCQRHRHRRRESCLPCVHRLEEMADLYRGCFLEQFFLGDTSAFEEWASLKREYFHREMMDALLTLGRHYERRGDYRRARRSARRQIALEPWREEAHRRLIRLLAADGQRSAALAQFEACRQALRDELDVEPTRQTVALYEAVRSQDPTPGGVRSLAPAHALPPSTTPFVGREGELAELANLLAGPDCRLVTLIGPGGIGKTRLAIQAAADQLGSFADGVIFVPLGPVDSASQVAPTIAQVLGLAFREEEDPEQQLLDYLRRKELLLLLDSIEHILESADLISKILFHAPGVVVIATSRERLNLREESAFGVRGLEYPADEVTTGAEVLTSPRSASSASGYSAIELFGQHARRVHSGFLLSDADTPDAIRICQLVEGLPLGVELAASWTRIRSCGQIAQEIEHTLDVLATDLRNVPERQRSIRATFEHSWSLLSAEERDLLARLSIFSGGFLSGAALQVTRASISNLVTLVDKSLVRRDSTGRYDMHSLLRQFAREKLDASPRMRHDTEIRYATFFATFLAEQGKQLRRARTQEGFSGLLSEIENARQAWRLAVAHDRAQLVDQSLEPLYTFYHSQCRFQEGIDLFSCAIDRWRGDTGRSHVLGRLLSRQGALHLQLCHYPEARAALEESLALLEPFGATADQIFGLVSLARLAHRQGDYEETVRLSTKSLALSREIGDCWGVTNSLLYLGVVRYRTGDVATAEALLEESLETAQESDNPGLLIAPLMWLGDIVCHRGDYTRGQALFETCLALTRELGDHYRVAVALNNLGTVFHVLENFEEAQSAYQESLDICREIGNRRRQAIALSNLGELAHQNGAYAEAESLCREGLAIGQDISDQWIVMACLNNLGATALSLREHEQAWRYFSEALTIAQTTHTLPLVFKVLVNVAALLASEGKSTHAAELLGLAQQHPASERLIQEEATRLLDALGLTPAGSIDRSLESIVAEILAQAGQPQDPHPGGHRSGITP